MSFYIHIQETPNPNAVKFISRYTVKSEGSSSYNSLEDAVNNPIATRILTEIEGVLQIYFFDNYITVTKEPSVDWDNVGDPIVEILQEMLPEHDPLYKDPGEEERKERDRSTMSPELLEIEEILDRTVRDYLVSDGGDIEIIEKKDNIVYVQFQGSCGTCPASAGGTLAAIQSVLRAELDPDIEVINIDGGQSLSWF